MLKLSPIVWWKGVLKNSRAEINHQFASIAVHLLSASATSASIERIFSNFGNIHSKIRNRLEGDTAAKLVFCYRMLRDKTDFETDDDPAPAVPSFGGDLPQGPTLNTSDAEDGSGSDD